MKNHKLLIAVLVFFLIINTTYFWEWRSGFLSVVAFIFIVLGYIIYPLVFIFQIILAIREKFKLRRRIILITAITLVLLLTYWKPRGIINFENWEGKDLLVADREGAANCTTTLRLKSNNKISVKMVCFGISKIFGTYIVRNDTIFFSNLSKGRHDFNYQFALVRKIETQNKKIVGELVLYENIMDKGPNSLWIIKNELISNSP